MDDVIISDGPAAEGHLYVRAGNGRAPETHDRDTPGQIAGNIGGTHNELQEACSAGALRSLLEDRSDEEAIGALSTARKYMRSYRTVGTQELRDEADYLERLDPPDHMVMQIMLRLAGALIILDERDADAA